MIEKTKRLRTLCKSNWKLFNFGFIIPPLLIQSEVPSQENERSCVCVLGVSCVCVLGVSCVCVLGVSCVCVLGVSIVSLSMVFLLYFETVLSMWY